MEDNYEMQEHKDKVIKRLQRIEGQVRGVKKMIENDRDCTDILNQMLAVSGALKGTLSVMIKGSLFQCMNNIQKDERGGERAVDDLVKTLSKAL